MTSPKPQRHRLSLAAHIEAKKAKEPRTLTASAAPRVSLADHVQARRTRRR